jgi:hypothetical protein
MQNETKTNGCKNNKILQFIEEVKIYEVIYKLNKRWDRNHLFYEFYQLTKLQKIRLIKNVLNKNKENTLFYAMLRMPK